MVEVQLSWRRVWILILAALLTVSVAGAEDVAGPEEGEVEAPVEPVCPVAPPMASPDTGTPGSTRELVAKLGEQMEEKSGWNIVPIPEIILDPNEGNTYGLMAVWLITNDRDEITYMVAPDVRYNDTKGVFPNFRLFGYPSPTRRFHIAVGKSTTKDENYEFTYSDRGLLDGKAFFITEVSYERDSTERFYGFGNDSPESGESNYTSAQFLGDAEAGWWFIDEVNVSYRMRIRRFEVQHGQVDSLPFIAVEHPDVRTRGLQPAVYWQHRLAITYDTRDSLDMPTTGNYANAYVDGADQHVGSATSFVAFGLDGKSFIPFRGERRNPVLALRGELNYVQGGTHTPFWLMNSLGGRRRLRGFGGDRFIDFNSFLLGGELRTRVYQRKLFGVNAELELAPFVETGQVFHKIQQSPFDMLRWVGGLGFRFLVRPQVVAFVDVGYGGEGQAVFTGIDYPF